MKISNFSIKKKMTKVIFVSVILAGLAVGAILIAQKARFEGERMYDHSQLVFARNFESNVAKLVDAGNDVSKMHEAVSSALTRNTEIKAPRNGRTLVASKGEDGKWIINKSEIKSEIDKLRDAKAAYDLSPTMKARLESALVGADNVKGELEAYMNRDEAVEFIGRLTAIEQFTLLHAAKSIRLEMRTAEIKAEVEGLFASYLDMARAMGSNLKDGSPLPFNPTIITKMYYIIEQTATESVETEFVGTGKEATEEVYTETFGGVMKFKAAMEKTRNAALLQGEKNPETLFTNAVLETMLPENNYEVHLNAEIRDRSQDVAREKFEAREGRSPSDEELQSEVEKLTTEERSRIGREAREAARELSDREARERELVEKTNRCIFEQPVRFAA